METKTNAGFTLPAYELKPQSSIEIKLDWEYIYGELTPGDYRLVKDVNLDDDSIPYENNRILIYAEFTIK